MYDLTLTNEELEFLLQLFNSDIPVTIKFVAPVASLKNKVENVRPRLSDAPKRNGKDIPRPPIGD
jgi:hypothetical protein